MSGLLSFVAYVGGSIVFAIAGVMIARKLMHGHVSEGHNDVACPIFATAGVLYAVLLAFLVIAIWTAYDNAHQNIEDEVTQLQTLYRLTAGMKYFSERDAMRGYIRTYTKAVIEQEWASQARDGTASEEARSAIGHMFQYFHKMPYSQSGSQVNGEVLRELTNVTHERNRRLLQARESLSPIMWLGLWGGGFVVVGMTFVLYTEKRWPHLLMSSLLAALIGSMLWVAVVLDRPFVGPVALTPEAFESCFNLYDDVDRGN